MRGWRLWVVGLGALLAGRLAGAEARVLFIGNSFTQGSPVPGGVPELFDRLARAGGQGDPLTVMSAAGGTDFRYHSTDATTRSNVGARVWTHVVLQNYSTEPTHLVDGTHSLSNHFTYGLVLGGLVRSNSPLAQVVLFETWARAAGHPLITGTSNASGFRSTTEFQAELRTNYQGLADRLNEGGGVGPPAVVAPVGSAWERAGALRSASDPQWVRLHGSDQYHANESGTYLAAAVIYSRVFGISPVGLSRHPLLAELDLPFTVSPTVLEEVAWAEVAGSAGSEGPVVFLQEPEGQTVMEYRPATFRAAVGGAPPFGVQWWSNGVAMAGAQALVWHWPAVTMAMNGTELQVTVSNRLSLATSRGVVLTVTPDQEAPELIGVETVDGRQVRLRFDETVDEATASGVEGYTVRAGDGGEVAVEAAAVEADGRTVRLSLGQRVSGGFTVEVREVRDLAGNRVREGTVGAGVAPMVEAWTVLIDFGSSGTPTDRGPAPDDPVRYWNNVGEVGLAAGGRLAGLVSVENRPTGVGLEMVRRFNGANANGTTVSPWFPADATRDSLFGNTELFNGLSGVYPAFRLTGLEREWAYGLTFYASRTGVSDRRETVYTVVGAVTNTVGLDAANNVTNVARLERVAPGAAGDLAIGLTPGPRNNNANHFTYLGVLRLELMPPRFSGVATEGEEVVLVWEGGGRLEWALDSAGPWHRYGAGVASPYREALAGGRGRYYRLVLGP